MRIAINIHRFSPSRGGGEMQTFNFARELARDGHEVHIFASSRDEDLQADSEGFIYHEVPTSRLRSFRELSFAMNSARLLKERDFDIIHGFGRTLLVDVSRLGGGVHIAWFWQDLMSYENRLARFLKIASRLCSLRHVSILILERRLYKRDPAPRIIAPSEMVKSHLARYYSVPRRRVSVIYNGVDLERFHPRNRDAHRLPVRRHLGIDDEVVVLFVANNFRLKGLRYLIKAMGFCRDSMRRRPMGSEAGAEKRDLKCVVVGRGHRGTYQRLAKRVGCEESLIFVGEAAAIERYYAAADIFVHPTFYDPCANVCLEALASGLPVITTIYNGSGEIITDGREGFTVSDPKDIPELASKIIHFLPDDVRAKASSAARELASRYGLETNYRRIIGVYEEALAERGCLSEA